MENPELAKTRFIDSLGAVTEETKIWKSYLVPQENLNQNSLKPVSFSSVA